jgi:hypothetical protein
MNRTALPKTIENEEQYRQASRTLTQKKKPSAILRLLMNSFEQHRQSRKYGWFRTWNKVDLMNFQSFKLNLKKYPAFVGIGKDLLNHETLAMTPEARAFVNELLADSSLMGFVFVHEYTHLDRQCEGATLSFGRLHEKCYRDRIDIIVEAPVVKGISQCLERVKVYVDPYRQDDKLPLWQGDIPSFKNEHAFPLFAVLSNVSWNWAQDESKLWNHWTSIYIDYFGDRRWPMEKSCFYVEGRESSRIELDIPEDINLQIQPPTVLESVA